MAPSSVWQGIKRTHGTAQNVKAPVLVDNPRLMVRSLRPGVIGARDRALPLLGFAGAFRRSELVGLNVEDAQFTSDGLVVMLRRSKADQEGEGRKVGIPYGSNLESGHLPSAQPEGVDGGRGHRARCSGLSRATVAWAGA